MRINFNNSFILNKIRTNKTAKKCLLGIGIGAANMMPIATPHSNSYVHIIEEVRNIKTKKSPSDIINWAEASTNLTKIHKDLLAKAAAKNLMKKQNAIVLKIINEDVHSPAAINKANLAKRIVKIANEYEADPLQIACIAKKETHFSENIKGFGQGMMQITSICVEDMFSRPHLYNKKLEDLKKIHNTPQKLYSAAKRQPDLNLRLGTILFQSKLKIENGNLRRALKQYNGSHLKDSYASQILNDIHKYKKQLDKI